MRTSTAQIFKKNLKSDHGFTLMEIMIALVLISIIFLSIPSTNPVSLRARLEQTLDGLDRAVRFTANESILRNAVTRIKFDLTKDPVIYVVEYSTKANLTLPTPNTDETKLSIKERELMAKQQSKINSQFSKVDEFMDKDQEILQDITLLGIATTTKDKISQSGEISIYFYPTGEKDSAIIFLSTLDEVAGLKIPAFRDGTSVDYQVFSDYELENLSSSQDNKMSEMYEKWLKSND